MLVQLTPDDPPERSARPVLGRASLHAEFVSAQDPTWQATLARWLAALPELSREPLTPVTQAKLGDSHRICEELLHVLAGTEPGEGRAPERALLAVRGLGRVQAVASMFATPGGTFIELIATAPWNLLGRGDPQDPRTVHGAGSALVARAIAWSALRGHGGRVALQAENPRTLRFYERIGFRRMTPADNPLALVPPGDKGWSPEIQRVAGGAPGPEEERSPWLVLDPAMPVALGIATA